MVGKNKANANTNEGLEVGRILSAENKNDERTEEIIDSLRERYEEIDCSGYEVNHAINAHCQRIEDCVVDTIEQVTPAEGLKTLHTLKEWLDEFAGRIEHHLKGEHVESVAAESGCLLCMAEYQPKTTQ